jgi:uncharacterized protein YjbJ (UPF0337 family)
MSTESAKSARKGLLNSAVGKAKEVAGALLNKDSLVKEGQLRQAEARAHKEAGTTEAIAEARGEQAVDDLAEAHERGREDLRVAARQAGAKEQAAEQDRQRQRAQAEERAEAERRAGETSVQRRAANEVGEAVSETRSQIREADRDEGRASERGRQARRRADAEEQAARRERVAAERLDPTSGGERTR